MVDVARIYTGYAGVGTASNWITRNYVTRYDLGTITSVDLGVATNALNALWEQAASYMPDGMTIQVRDVCEILDVGTGELTADLTATGPPGPVSCTDANSFVSGSGARMQWQTDNILYGRHVHGSTAILPICEDAFTNGDPNSGLKASLLAGASTMLGDLHGGSLNLVIYTRPKPSGPRPGAVSVVTGANVLAAPGTLRRRKS